jgi:hypothetical protein
VDAVASLTPLTHGVGRNRDFRPCPAATMIKGATVRAYCRFMELESCLIGIMDSLLKATLNEWRMAFHVSSFHGLFQL